MKPIAIIAILSIFCIAFGINLLFSLKKINDLKKEESRLEEANRIIAKQIFRSWLFFATGVVTIGIWMIARTIDANPGVQNFWMTFSGLSLLVGISQLIGYYLVKKGF